jgi:hypothetical protein
MSPSDFPDLYRLAAQNAHIDQGALLVFSMAVAGVVILINVKNIAPNLLPATRFIALIGFYLTLAMEVVRAIAR